MCISVFAVVTLKPGWKNNDRRTDVSPYPFPLQPLLLLLLEVFLPLQTLLLRLLPGFSLSLFFLKNTHRRESNHNFNAGRRRGEKNSAKITCLLRNKGVVSLYNYCLQPQKGYFPLPLCQKDLFLTFTALWGPVKAKLKPVHDYIGSRLTNICQRPQGGGKA